MFAGGEPQDGAVRQRQGHLGSGARAAVGFPQRTEFPQKTVTGGSETRCAEGDQHRQGRVGQAVAGLAAVRGPRWVVRVAIDDAGLFELMQRVAADRFTGVRFIALCRTPLRMNSMMSTVRSKRFAASFQASCGPIPARASSVSADRSFCWAGGIPNSRSSSVASSIRINGGNFPDSGEERPEYGGDPSRLFLAPRR